MKAHYVLLATISLLLSNVNVFAQEIDDIDDISEERPTAKKSTPNKKAEAEPASGPAFDFRGAYGLLRGSSTIGGDNFKADLPLSPGHFRAYEFRYNGATTTYILRYRNQSIIFDNLPSVTPSEVDASKDHALLSFASKPWAKSGNAFARSVAFSRGAFFSSRRVVQTTPRSVMTSNQAAGLQAGFESIYGLNRTLDLETHLDIELPIMFRESRNQTGYYNYGNSFEGGLALSYSIVPWQQWSIGSNFRQSTVQFSGTGEQGVNNGSDVQWDMWFPLELRVRI